MNKLEKLHKIDIQFDLGPIGHSSLEIDLYDPDGHVSHLEESKLVDLIGAMALSLNNAIDHITALESEVELLKKHFGSHIFPPNHTTTPPIMETDKQ